MNISVTAVAGDAVRPAGGRPGDRRDGRDGGGHEHSFLNVTEASVGAAVRPVQPRRGWPSAGSRAVVTRGRSVRTLVPGRSPVGLATTRGSARGDPRLVCRQGPPDFESGSAT